MIYVEILDSNLMGLNPDNIIFLKLFTKRITIFEFASNEENKY